MINNRLFFLVCMLFLGTQKTFAQEEVENSFIDYAKGKCQATVREPFLDGEGYCSTIERNYYYPDNQKTFVKYKVKLVDGVHSDLEILEMTHPKIYKYLDKDQSWFPQIIGDFPHLQEGARGTLKANFRIQHDPNEVNNQSWTQLLHKTEGYQFSFTRRKILPFKEPDQCGGSTIMVFYSCTFR